MSEERRLVHHGLAYRMQGFPIYEYNDEIGERELVGYINEPRWRESDLTESQRAELEAEITQELVGHEGEMTRDKVRWHLLEWEGVDHDEHKRGKPVDPIRPARGYECSVCGDWIMAKDPGDSPFVGGPLDGRWIVTNGRPAWDYALPNDDFNAALIGGPSLAMKRITYWRDQRGVYRFSGTTAGHDPSDGDAK